MGHPWVWSHIASLLFPASSVCVRTSLPLASGSPTGSEGPFSDLSIFLLSFLIRDKDEGVLLPSGAYRGRPKKALFGQICILTSYRNADYAVDRKPHPLATSSNPCIETIAEQLLHNLNLALHDAER